MKKEKFWKIIEEYLDEDRAIEIDQVIKTKNHKITFSPIFLENRIEECDKCSACNVCESADVCPTAIVHVVNKKTKEKVFITK